MKAAKKNTKKKKKKMKNKKKKEKTAAAQWMCKVQGKVFRLGPLQCKKLAMGQTSIVLRQQELAGHGASWYRFRLTRMIRDEVLDLQCGVSSGPFSGTTVRLTRI